MTTEMNRRGVLAGAAALPATTLPVIAAPAAALPDAHEALARLDYVIHVLRNCYICEGWKLDEEGAEHALKFFRRQAAQGRWDGEEDWDENHAAEQTAAFKFLSDHGQCLDWVIRGDPR